MLLVHFQTSNDLTGWIAKHQSHNHPRTAKYPKTAYAAQDETQNSFDNSTHTSLDYKLAGCQNSKRTTDTTNKTQLNTNAKLGGTQNKTFTQTQRKLTQLTQTRCRKTQANFTLKIWTSYSGIRMDFSARTARLNIGAHLAIYSCDQTAV